MTEPGPPIEDSLPREILQRVFRACDRFEQAWRSGARPRIEAYLDNVSEPERSELLRELVALEIRLKRDSGEPGKPGEYQSRFPNDSRILDSAFESLALEANQHGAGLTRTWIPGPGGSGSGEEEFPQKIGKYLLLNPIGDGGQGWVFRVLHPQLHGEFVLKLARKAVAGHSPQRDSLRSEGRLLARLDHPSLARVIDLDFDGDRPFLVLEHVPGRTLHQYAAEDHPSPREAARLVAELAHAVAYLHAEGVIHQDIKPRNIVLDAGGRPRLIDFGLARLRNAWSDGWDVPTGGTPQFMAPEQARGETRRVGPASDIFALGAVLYFLLCGHPPFQGRTIEEIREKAERCAFDRNALRRRGIPRALVCIVLRAMAAEPEKRYPTSETLAKELERFLRRPKWLLRLASALGAAALLALVLGLMRPWAGPAQTPLRIESLEIRHYREDPAKGTLDLGRVGADSEVCRPDDVVRIRAQLNAPAYCYLIALHPNGQTQLYYPKDETQSPDRLSELDYPLDSGYFSPLTDGEGLQAFVLVASRQQLPSFHQWQAKAGSIPWQATNANDAGVWRYDGGPIERLGSLERSQPRKPIAPVPPSFSSACRFLAGAIPGEKVVQAWAFPVSSSAEHAASAHPER